MFNCIIVDDEPYAIDVLTSYIKAIPSLNLVKFYTDPLLALSEISVGEVLDFAFLDVQMPQLSGIDLASAIKNKVRHVVFSTSYREHGYKAFESGADAYLLKPYDLGKFALTLNRLINQAPIAEPVENYFFVKNADDLVIRKINYADIYAVESMKNHIKIHLQQQVIVAYMSLSEVFKALIKQPGFMQLHRSFIIAARYIETIEGQTVELSNGLKFNVGSKFQKSFSNYIASNSIHSFLPSDALQYH